MKRKILAIISMLLILLTNIAGCNNKEIKNTGEKKNITVRVGDQPNFFLLKIADKQGYFKEEFEKDGIAIDVKSFLNGPAIVESFASGDLDIGILGAQPLIQAKANNIDLKAISSSNYTERGFALLASKGSGISSLKDLKGKKIVAALGTNSHQVLLTFLESVGIKENEVEIVNLNDNEALTALDTNRVDAAVFAEPQISKAKKLGAKLITDATGYGNIACVYVGRNEFLKENPEIASRFLKVLDKAAKWSLENREKVIEIAAKATDTSEENVAINFDSRDRSIDIRDEIFKDPINNTIKFLKRQGLTKVEVNVDDVIDTSYFKASGIK